MELHFQFLGMPYPRSVGEMQRALERIRASGRNTVYLGPGDNRHEPGPFKEFLLRHGVRVVCCFDTEEGE